MKKCYQVYAKCVNNPRPVRELNWWSALDLARDTLLGVYFSAYERKIFDGVPEENEEDAICAVVDAFADRVRVAFEEEETINCGDFCIIFSEEEPTRPNKCGYDDALIYDPSNARAMVECFYINS